MVVLGEGSRHELTEIAESNYADLQPLAGRRPAATLLAKGSHRNANRRYLLGPFPNMMIRGRMERRIKEGEGLASTTPRFNFLEPSFRD